ncbi:hypothetical protein [Desulfovibrio subterraneus]|nr:hypothetical protein [Desulfovibrio subterraneus]
MMSTEKVWPDITDDDLWLAVQADIEAQYPGRFTMEYVRDAFERTCAKYDNYVPLDRFMKKVRMVCLWERPLVPHKILHPEDFQDEETQENS